MPLPKSSYSNEAGVAGWRKPPCGGHQCLVALTVGVEIYHDVVGRGVIFQRDSRAAIAEQGHTALVLRRAHAQSRIAYQQQSTANVACCQEISGNRHGIHAATTAHGHVQTEAIFGQRQAVLQNAGSRRSAIVARHGLENQDIDAVPFPTQLGQQTLGSRMAKVGGANVIGGNVPPFIPTVLSNTSAS